MIPSSDGRGNAAGGGVPPELITLRDLVRWGASRFAEAGLHFGHGTDNALDEAAWLALHALHLPLDLDGSWLDARLDAQEREAVAAVFHERIRSRRPAAYITGEAWFAGLPFHVDERVLVPRSPIAELIEQRFEPWVETGSVHAVLDLCTGSGCIAVAAAQAFPSARVWATDLSEDALAVARRNVARHGLGERITLLHSDLFEGLGEGRFELIVSNPPYVDATGMAALAPEYAHEPRLGLAAGEDGLDLALRILAGAADFLAPRGVLVLEVGAGADALADTVPFLALDWPVLERGGAGVCVVGHDALAAERAPLRALLRSRTGRG